MAWGFLGNISTAGALGGMVFGMNEFFFLRVLRASAPSAFHFKNQWFGKWMPFFGISMHKK
jgi:hypothetical protein